MKKPPELTPAEMRLLADYRSMDGRAKWVFERHGARLAEAYPARLDLPKLRLVKGSQPCG